jgi:hypothetical protein
MAIPSRIMIGGVWGGLGIHRFEPTTYASQRMISFGKNRQLEIATGMNRNKNQAAG